MSSEPLVVCGLNHKTAPVEVREKFVFTDETLPDSLKSLVLSTGIEEAVILSTCNRTEIYSQTEDYESVLSWLAQSQSVPLDILKAHAYVYLQEKTVKHALRVASGIDSMVLGEPQILGQLKQAVNTAHHTGTLTSKGKLRRFFDYTFYAARQIRSETAVGSNPVSLGYAILHLAKNIFADLNRCRVLLIGAGEIIDLVAKYFQTRGITEFLLANRTFSTAEKIGLTLQASTISLQEIAKYLPEVDIVVSAIHTLMPLVGKGMVETALKRRKYRPLLMIDLAVPRNMETEIKSLEGVYLYHMDELQSILAENDKKRHHSVKMAEEMISSQTDRFYEEINYLKTNKLIQTYRVRMHKVRDEILQKALREIEMGDTPEEVLQKMAYLLTNKLLHDPCLWLKKTL
jgi:glutamyl-tRNA reductase